MPKKPLKEIPWDIAKKFVDLCIEHQDYDSALGIFRSRGIIDDLKERGYSTKLQSVWLSYVNAWIIYLYKGKTRTQLAEALAEKSIFLDSSKIGGHLKRLHESEQIDLKEMKEGKSGARKGPRRTSQHFEGVPFKLASLPSLTKPRPKKRR